VLKKSKGQNAQYSELDKGSILLFKGTVLCKFAVLLTEYVNMAVPARFPLQELPPGADRPLSGTRGGQSPGCLVQTKAPHIALLCLLTTWLCHQVL